MKTLATRLIGVTLLVSLVGCAAPGRTAHPADFPLHQPEQGWFTLHWRLDRQDGAVTAVGLVEVPGGDRIAEVTLALEGLDRDGRVISRGFAYARPRAFAGDVSWPFTVRLRPTGQEERFALRISDVTWRLMRGAR